VQISTRILDSVRSGELSPPATRHILCHEQKETKETKIVGLVRTKLRYLLFRISGNHGLRGSHPFHGSRFTIHRRLTSDIRAGPKVAAATEGRPFSTFYFLLSTSRVKTLRGFTLIELIVVITIIAILIGLLFPAINGAQRQAKKVQAKNDLMQIVAAMNAYYTDYGKFAVDDSKQGFDTLLGDPGGTYDNAFIFNAVRAIADGNWNTSNKLNPRQVVYFNAPNVKDPANPKSGFATQDTTSNGNAIKKGGFVDPWGNEYLVTVDSDYDGWTMDFHAYSDLTYTTVTGGAGTFPAVQGSCTASSWGQDNKQGTNGDGKYKGSDDVIS
jgi:prepilin-type N-terminal cleavage/methylation domain-containing protein